MKRNKPLKHKRKKETAFFIENFQARIQNSLRRNQFFFLKIIYFELMSSSFEIKLETFAWNIVNYTFIKRYIKFWGDKKIIQWRAAKSEPNLRVAGITSNGVWNDKQPFNKHCGKAVLNLDKI